MLPEDLALPPSFAALYPFSGRRSFDTGVGRMHYLDEGTGHPVVMVHGNPSWSFLYRDLVLRLRVRHRCIVPDHLGCGLSDNPELTQFPYTLASHADNLQRLLDAAGVDTFDLIVHDWGGAIGMAVATRCPERVRRVVVTNTAAFLSPRIPFRIAVCRWPVIGRFLVCQLNGFVRAATRMTTVRPLSPALRAAYLFPSRTLERRRAVHRFVLDIPMEAAHPTRPVLAGIEESLHRLKGKPVLICWGAQDWCFNRTFLDEWKRRFPEAEFQVEAEAGHFLFEDKGDVLLPRVAAFVQ